MKIFELEIPKLKYSKFFKEITHFLKEKDNKPPKVIFTPNPEMCLKTLRDREFLKTLQKADYLTSDGIGLYLAYQIEDFFQKNIVFHGKNKNLFLKVQAYFLLPLFIFRIIFEKDILWRIYGERICGSDITEDLVYYCENKGIRIAILDPFFPQDLKKCEAQEHFSENLKKVFPDLHFDHYVVNEKNIKKAYEKIATGKAKVLFSTLWMGRQEYSVIEAVKQCPNLRLALAVGSSFDYFTGFQKRAPSFFRKIGFEWLYRIFTSPHKRKRLKRIFQAVVVFPYRVIHNPS